MHQSTGSDNCRRKGHRPVGASTVKQRRSTAENDEKEKSGKKSAEKETTRKDLPPRFKTLTCAGVDAWEDDEKDFVCVGNTADWYMMVTTRGANPAEYVFVGYERAAFNRWEMLMHVSIKLWAWYQVKLHLKQEAETLEQEA